MIYFRTQPYNSDIQIWAMKKHYPDFSIQKRGKYDIEFVGRLTVKEELPTYTISVTYQGEIRPLVKIIKPILVENPPHIYRRSESLCLYHPRNFKWYKERLIANEIMEWTSTWIYLYEVWLQTDIWYSPEASHDIDKN